MSAQKIIKFLSSLKLAVIVILSIATITAVGTFVEAQYDATAASKLVYKTPWMFGIMGLLSINLIAVMVDRWPWKRRHVPFVLAHIGILILLAGSLITMQYGLDGSVRVGIGESNKFVSIPNTDLVIWSSFDGDRFSKITDQEVDFFIKRPEKYPFSFDLLEGPLKVVRYEPYAHASKKISPTENPKVGGAIRFLLQNPHVNQSDWIVQPRPGQWGKVNLGPATLFFGEGKPLPTGGNEIFLSPLPQGKVKYHLFYRDTSKKFRTGVLSSNQSLETGWMGLTFKFMVMYPHAEETWEFKAAERPTPLTNAAIEIEFQGKRHWVQLGDVIKLYSPNAVYILSYGMRKIDLGFDILLKRFDMGKYQGTQRAASYQSLVEVPGIGEHLISMNEPLKHKGLTVYQASFQQDPTDGTPVASIFSVNYDPGRWVKYLGSLIISLGIIFLFYDRRKAARALAPTAPLDDFKE